MISIFVREWKRLFRQPKVMVTTFLMPCVLIIGIMWLLFSGVIEKTEQDIVVVTKSKQVENFINQYTEYNDIQVYMEESEELRELYDKGKVAVLIELNLEQGKAKIKYDATKIKSNYSIWKAQNFLSALEVYQNSEILYESYTTQLQKIDRIDISTAKEIQEKNLKTIIGIFTAVFVFLIGQPISTFALDAYVGERERGTYDSIRLSGVGISKFVLGKVLFTTSVGVIAGGLQICSMLVGAKCFMGDLGQEIIIENYLFLIVAVVLSICISLMLLVSTIIYLSTYFDKVKEASMYASIGIIIFTALTQANSVVQSGVWEYVPLINMNQVILNSAMGINVMIPLVISFVVGIGVIGLLTKMSVNRLKMREQ